MQAVIACIKQSGPNDCLHQAIRAKHHWFLMHAMIACIKQSRWDIIDAWCKLWRIVKNDGEEWCFAWHQDASKDEQQERSKTLEQRWLFVLRTGGDLEMERQANSRPSPRRSVALNPKHKLS
jgi:hypothetical protein